ncbi:MAG: hypothetical protein AAFO84_16120 [Cyanobacteria bacterium J06598_1]
MIGGIFETIGQTLGVGKKKYFLELDDAAENSVKALKKPVSKPVETAKKASADVAKKVTEVAEAAADKTQAVAKETKAAAKSGKKKAAKKVEKAGKAAKKSAEKKAAPAKGKKAVAEKGEKVTAAPEEVAKPAAPAAPDPEELIVAAIAAGGRKTDASGNVVAGATNFATDYLITQSSSRRRPGPSLGKFKGMAKDVNPRLKG